MYVQKNSSRFFQRSFSNVLLHRSTSWKNSTLFIRQNEKIIKRTLVSFENKLEFNVPNLQLEHSPITHQKSFLLNFLENCEQNPPSFEEFRSTFQAIRKDLSTVRDPEITSKIIRNLVFPHISKLNSDEFYAIQVLIVYQGLSKLSLELFDLTLKENLLLITYESLPLLFQAIIRPGSSEELFQKGFVYLNELFTSNGSLRKYFPLKTVITSKPLIKSIFQFLVASSNYQPQPQQQQSGNHPFSSDINYYFHFFNNYIKEKNVNPKHIESILPEFMKLSGDSLSMAEVRGFHQEYQKQYYYASIQNYPKILERTTNIKHVNEEKEKSKSSSSSSSSSSPPVFSPSIFERSTTTTEGGETKLFNHPSKENFANLLELKELSMFIPSFLNLHHSYQHAIIKSFLRTNKISNNPADQTRLKFRSINSLESFLPTLETIYHPIKIFIKCVIIIYKMLKNINIFRKILIKKRLLIDDGKERNLMH
jgi:hypothetical protein